MRVNIPVDKETRKLLTKKKADLTRARGVRVTWDQLMHYMLTNTDWKFEKNPLYDLNPDEWGKKIVMTLIVLLPLLFV